MYLHGLFFTAICPCQAGFHNALIQYSVREKQQCDNLTSYGGRFRSVLPSGAYTCNSPRTTKVLFAGGSWNDLPIARGGRTQSTSGSNIQEDTTSSLDSYYLLASRKVWFSIALCTIGLFSLQSVLNRMGTLSAFHPSIVQAFTSNKAIHWILPHLANACCILQLIGNLFLGVGCFGFNKILGPCRPFFLSMLLLSTRSSIQQYFPLWNHAFLPWMIALMPEWIHLSNTYFVKQFRAKQTERIKSDDGTTRSVPNVPEFMSAELELNISGMGCVACIQKIDSSTRKSSNNVIDASSWLFPKDDEGQKKGGKAKVSLKGTSINDLECTAAKVIQAVEKSGFHCESKQLTIKEGEEKK